MVGKHLAPLILMSMIFSTELLAYDGKADKDDIFGQKNDESDGDFQGGSGNDDISEDDLEDLAVDIILQIINRACISGCSHADDIYEQGQEYSTDNQRERTEGGDPDNAQWVKDCMDDWTKC